MRTSMVRLLLNTNPGDGNGNTDPPTPKADDKLAARLKAHKGDGVALAGELYSQVKQLQAVNATLKAKVPKDGAVVLEGDDATAWNEFKTLNLKPKDVEAIVGEHKTLKATEAKRVRDDSLSAAGFNPKTLGPLLPADAAIEVKDGEKGRDGKPARAATIRVKDGDAEKAVPLSDWIKANLGDYPAGTFGGPDAPTPAPQHRGAPPTPHVRRDPPAPGQGGNDTAAEHAGIAADLGMNIGFAGF